jgi:membrane protein
MNRAEETVRAIDRLQQRVPWLAFPVAVWKKFGDDQAGNLAALIAYYAFASLFPLLLVLVTVVDIVLRHDPALQDKVKNSAFSQFPVIGQQLSSDVHSLKETGAALAIGLILTFLGARGVANAVQNALNTIWAVPYTRRPGFPWNQLRSIGLILVVGIGMISTSLLSGLVAAGAGHVLGGPLPHIGAFVVALVLNIGLFWLGFRLGTASEVSTRSLLLSAVIAGVVWQILQLVGYYYVSHVLNRSSALYGIFGLVLGVIAWLYLQAQFTLYAVEAAVVKEHRLWPRSLVQPPLTPQDRQAYEMYVWTAQRRPEQSIEVRTEQESRTGTEG